MLTFLVAGTPNRASSASDTEQVRAAELDSPEPAHAMGRGHCLPLGTGRATPGQRASQASGASAAGQQAGCVVQAWQPPRWLVWAGVPVGTWPSMTTCMPTGEGARPCFSRNSNTPCSDTSRSWDLVPRLCATPKRANAWHAMQHRECRQQAIGPCLVGCKKVVCPAVVLHVHCLQTSHDW